MQHLSGKIVTRRVIKLVTTSKRTAAKHGPPSLHCGQRTLRPNDVAKRLHVIAEGLLYSQASVNLSCQTAARATRLCRRKPLNWEERKHSSARKLARSTSHRFEQNTHPAVGGRSEIYQILGHPAGMPRSPKRNNAFFGLPQKFSGGHRASWPEWMRALQTKQIVPTSPPSSSSSFSKLS